MAALAIVSRAAVLSLAMMGAAQATDAEPHAVSPASAVSPSASTRRRPGKR